MNDAYALTESTYYILLSLFEPRHGYGIMQQTEALSGGRLTDFERLCDNAVNDYLKTARLVPFGDAPVVAYLAAKENEFTAIRILLTGKLAGLEPDTIRERLRDAYV